MATDLEVFRDTVNHRPPARILYGAGYTPDLDKRVKEHVGKDPAAHYGYARYGNLAARRPDGLPPIDYSSYWQGQELPAGTTFDPFGVAMVPSGFYHFWGYISPLRNATSLKEIENYPLDDMTSWDFSWVPQAVEKAHAAGRPARCMLGHMYENSWQIRGYEQFLMDTIEQPAWAECMLEKFFQKNMTLAVAMVRGGVDLICCGDDVANQNSLMFAPDVWRKLIHSRWTKVWKAIKEINPDVKIWYHTDGNVTSIVPELVEAGLDILNPLQPECLDIDALHKRFGRKLTFDGCLGTQSTMPFGTPQQVKDRIKYLIDTYGRNGGLIITPTHVLEPDVPIANIDAMAEACREYGTFRS